MKVLRINNIILGEIQAKISAWELDIPQASARRRVLRAIKPLIADINDSRIELQNKYAEKDSEGKIVVGADGHVKTTPENLKLMSDAWDDMIKQEVVIVIGPDNERDWETVRNIVKDQQAKFIEEKKNGFNAADFEYSETLEEITIALTPHEDA